MAFDTTITQLKGCTKAELTSDSDFSEDPFSSAFSGSASSDFDLEIGLIVSSSINLRFGE